MSKIIDDLRSKGFNADEVVEAIKYFEARVAELRAERDDYKKRWENTGCTRHHAMELAIDLYEKERARVAELEAERAWWHNRAWEIDSAYTFHNKNICLNRDEWEKQQQELKETDEQESNDG
jgi:hypothetical protein